jgi:WD40 repeat protein
LAGRLAGADAEVVEAHVEGCPVCQQRLEELAGRADGRHEDTAASSGADFLGRLAREPPAGAGPGLDTVRTARPLPPAATGGAAAATPEVPPPAVAGYEVLGELGRGGMGIVYKAWHNRLRRVVALKMLNAAASSGVERTRLLTEAEALARLQHPHIVPVYEVGEADGRPFLVLEYVDGGNLAQRLDGTPWPAGQAAALVEVLARAMDYAHRRGVVHRDLKPGNVLLAADGTPKITDFGLAKLLIGGGGDPTWTGQVLGTPSYMAPEQARGGTGVGPATDVYALGAILYELLTGRPPFKAETPLETLWQAQSGEAVPPSRLRPKLPRDLATICLKCLEKEPSKRYASALALAEDLRRFLSHEPIRARPLGRLGRAARWCRRKPALAAVGGLAALALAATVILSVLFGIYQARASARLRSALREADRSSAGLALDRGLSLCEQEDVGRGLLWLTRGLELATKAGDADLQCVIRRNLAGWGGEFHSLHACLPHAAWVTAAAFSRDGRWVVTSSDDGTARLWDVATGKPAGPPLEHGSPVRWVALGPEGRTVLTLDAAGRARLWGLGAGGQATPLRHGAEILTAALSPDGRRVLTASADGRVKAWEAPAGTYAAALDCDCAARVLAFSPDGRQALTAGKEGTARLWDLATGKLVKALALPRPSRVCSVAFSPDGRTVLTGCENGIAWLLGAGAVSEPLPLKHGDDVAVGALAFSPDGRNILTGGRDWKARLWDAATGRPRETPPLQHYGPVTSVAFSPDGRLVLTGSLEGRACLWDAATGKPFHGPLQHQGEVHAAAFSPDGKMVVTAGRESAARLWRIAPDRAASRSFAHPEWPYAMAFSPDGRTLAIGGECGDDGDNHPVRLWDGATGKLRCRPLRHARPIRALDFSPDGRLLLTGCEDGALRLWDTATGDLRDEYPDRAKVSAAAWSRDGKWLVAGTRQGAVRLWERGSKRDPITLGRHRGPVEAVVFSPDGRLVLSGSADLTARLWDTAAGQPVGEPLRHQGPVWTVAFSPDGRTALTGSDDKAARLWDVATGRPLGAPLLDQHAVRLLAFSPDGTMLLKGGWAGTSRLWDVATGKPVGVPLRHGGAALAAAFDGGRVRVASDGNRAVCVGEVPRPAPGECERLTLWAQVATSLELGPEGGIWVLDARAWQERRQRLEELGGPPLP